MGGRHAWAAHSSCHVGAIADLQAACPSPRQPIETRGEHRKGQTAPGYTSLTLIGSTILGHGVEPEEGA